MNTRETGAQREKLACEYLEKQGVRIKERNFRCRQGEIDIIGYDGNYLVVFEVKYRRNTSRGSASEAVGYGKQRKICSVFDYYRMIHKCKENQSVRFDVIAMDGDKIQWIKNAFPYQGRMY